MKIAIYTEGGFNLGLGNIYRMLELSKGIKTENSEVNVVFITSSEQYIVELIKDHGFNVKVSESNHLVDSIAEEDFSLLIIDKLGVEEEFIQHIKIAKGTDFKIVIFGNNSSANRLADFIVNAIIGTDFTNKKYVDNNQTLYFTGPRYLTLRDEFKPKSYRHKNLLKNILLLFGGTDQANLSCTVLRDLLSSGVKYDISLVIGKGYRFNDELEVLINNNTNVKIYRDITNVNEVMVKADFLITSPGTAMFEGFYIGLPCLALFQNESQKQVFRDFFMTKSYSDIENIEVFVKNTYNEINLYHQKLYDLEIGQGKNDIINQIIKLI